MRIFLLLLSFLISSPAWAQMPEPSTPALNIPAEKEATAKGLFRELHCMVCNGQSLADSDAKLAEDMRNLIRQQLLEGQTPDAIKQFLRERYGDSILMDPPVSSSTLALWLAPLLMLLAGGAWMMRRVFSSSPSVTESINHDD